MQLTIDQAKANLLQAATHIRAAVGTELPATFSGHSYNAGGVMVTIYSSGCISMPSDCHLPSDAIKAEREALQRAYDWYLAVRQAAMSIAPTLLPETVYVRRGARFVKFAA